MTREPTRLLVATGQIVGGCRVERFVGRGGMGEVYQAQHLALRRRVALKILPPELVDPIRVQRFLREARSCAQIDHPNVITIHHVGKDGGLYYIIMQYVDGLNLTQLVEAQGGPLPWRLALKVMRLAARGAAAVHRHGLVHRDIKPSNIMVSNDSRVFLMDFGLAREEAQSDLTQSGVIVGTPPFMSPEQCAGQALDHRSDIFSLGSTLYFLLTAKLPFEGPPRAVWTQISSGHRPAPVHAVNQFVPQKVSDFVAKAMSFDPGGRFPDAETMARQITALFRTPALPPTVTYETESAAKAPVETQAVAELAPLELIPEETLWERVRPTLPWIIAGASACLLVLTLLLVLMLSSPGAGSGDQQPPSGATADQQSQASQSANQPTPNPPAPNMVYIPAGQVQLGNTTEQLRQYAATLDSLKNSARLTSQFLETASQTPVQRVSVPAFWIDKYEVTNAEYAKFVKATGRAAPKGWNGTDPPAGEENNPVVNIQHADAVAYARWANKKLPTEAQWVRAFRGDKDWMLPWGNAWDTSRANVGENALFRGPGPVDSTPRDISQFGVYNLVGNVDEMMRELVLQRGVLYVMAKGSDSFRKPGAAYGIACMRFYYDVRTAVNRGTGFRCVIEQRRTE